MSDRAATGVLLVIILAASLLLLAVREGDPTAPERECVQVSAADGRGLPACDGTGM